MTDPRFPVIIYRGAVKVSGNRFDPAVVMDTLFETNGWGRSWRDTVYDFIHYRSQIHEVMGVARGTATLEFGGVKGRKVRLKAGDVAILPAGTGHRLIEASRNFLVGRAMRLKPKRDFEEFARYCIRLARRQERCPGLRRRLLTLARELHAASSELKGSHERPPCLPVFPAIGCERHWLDRDDAVALETFCEVFWVAGDVTRNNKGAATLSFMAVNLYAWSSEVSRVRILALSLVAAITLSSGALAQGGGGGGGGAGGGASGAGGAAGASGARGAAGASGTPGTTGNSSSQNSGVSVQPPGSTGQNAVNSPGTGVGPGPNPGPFNK